jgi:multicomponent Na+:H+ antiporter subunit E
VATPWSFLRPRRLAAVVVLAASAGWRVVRANCSLAARIWSPRLPLRTGMLIVPTTARSEGALTAVGLITSVIVDNQLVDLDGDRHELQYHAVWIESEEPNENRNRINGPIEGRIQRVIQA